MFERKFTSKPICLTLSCPCHFRAQPAICDAETLVLGPNPQFFLQTFDIYVDLEEVFKLHKEKRSFSFIGRHQHLSLKHDLVVGGSRSNPNKNTTWESEGRSRQRMARKTCSFWKDEEKRAASVAPRPIWFVICSLATLSLPLTSNQSHAALVYLLLCNSEATNMDSWRVREKYRMQRPQIEYFLLPIFQISRRMGYGQTDNIVSSYEVLFSLYI